MSDFDNLDTDRPEHRRKTRPVRRSPISGRVVGIGAIVLFGVAGLIYWAAQGKRTNSSKQENAAVDQGEETARANKPLGDESPANPIVGQQATFRGTVKTLAPDFNGLEANSLGQLRPLTEKDKRQQETVTTVPLVVMKHKGLEIFCNFKTIKNRDFEKLFPSECVGREAAIRGKVTVANQQWGTIVMHDCEWVYRPK